MQTPAAPSPLRASPLRQAAAWLAGLLTLLAGLAYSPLASADPPKSITQKWRNTGSCAWDFPGANTYMGMVAPSVERYPDIPPSVRTKLRSRMDKQAYDDFVVISRNSIAGRHMYEPVIGHMQFGSRLICGQVTRTRWQPDHIERGLVYCESGICIMVPTTGRNISRVKRKAQLVASAQAPAPEANTEEPKEPDLLEGLPAPAAGPAGAGGGGGGFASPVAPTFTQVAANTFSPMASLSPYSGTSGAAPASNTGSGGGAGSGGTTGGEGGGTTGGTTNPGGNVNGGTGTGTGGTTGGVTTPVPEPETYVLMLLGLGMLGGAAKRRSRQQACGGRNG
jgi:hypothetical protein